MVNPVRRLLFGTGELPDDLRAQLLKETSRFVQEGVAGSARVRVNRAPGVYGCTESQGTSAALAVTTRRLVVCTGRLLRFEVPVFAPTRRVIGVPLATVPGACGVVAERPGLLTLTRTTSRHHGSGEIRARLRTAHAARIVEFLSP